MKRIQDLQISPDVSILNTLKQMNQLDYKLLLVMHDAKFLGLISIGDIQRAVIQNLSLETPIHEILRNNFRIATSSDSFEAIKKMMFDYRMEFCPVISDDKRLIDVFFWKDVFEEQKLQPKEIFDIPIVIMAGGLGSRLKPLTNVLPKPLIPIGEKTMLEDIFERFSNHGCNTFHISVNYKANLIEYYIRNQNLPYKLNFFKEEKPMGTAGSLSLLKGMINETFFVSNCDILIEQDYSEILDYHRSNKNEITIIAALKNIPIPYGTIETGKNGRLLKLEEKPELTIKINSGMYILEPHLLEEIPDQKFFHITQLIDGIMARKGNIGVFPVSEKSWKDVGNWNEYMNISQQSL